MLGWKVPAQLGRPEPHLQGLKNAYEAKKAALNLEGGGRGGSLHDLTEQELNWNLGSDTTATKIALSDCLVTLFVCLFVCPSQNEIRFFFFYKLGLKYKPGKIPIENNENPVSKAKSSRVGGRTGRGEAKKQQMEGGELWEGRSREV